jgi:ABC-2 type transport system ATP-binding protein
MTTTPAIVTDRLTKTYGANRGIRDVDLIVAQGEIFGFLGPNGAGKSTTMRTLLGFMAPTSGSGRIFGLDIVADSVEIRRHVGNLPGEFAMEDRMTGRELVRLYADLRGVTDLSYAEEVARRLDADLDRPTRRLSRGNKQKVAIVTALFHQPRLIMLDEPTSGLDPLVQDTFLDILLEAKQRGQTVFLSSHVLPEIERVADRVGIIREGKLIATENPRELTGRTFRHVRISFREPASDALLARFRQLAGVDHFEVVDRQHLAFQAHGDINEVVRLAGEQALAAIDIERPSLEEMFIKYYDGDITKGAAA